MTWHWDEIVLGRAGTSGIVTYVREREEQKMINQKKMEEPGGERSYHRGEMQKEIIVKLLKEKGCRITKQRLMLLDVILSEECSSCKEIFYKATKLDRGIGTATVYRMINILEEIGAISRKNMYKIACGMNCGLENACTIEFADNTTLELSARTLNQVIQTGLRECGYEKKALVRSVTATVCDDDTCNSSK